MGNLTRRNGWGADAPSASFTYTDNRRDGSAYDAAGNVTNDGAQAFSYDATGQQTTANYTGYVLQQGYNGDGLRVLKDDNGETTYYLRSAALGGRVVCELRHAAGFGWYWARGYVYLGGQLLAVQRDGVWFVHEDPVTKSKRVTDMSGAVVSAVETDPWGADTSRNNTAGFQPRRYTTYQRDANGSDEATLRRYNARHARFDQPDPYDGSYDLADPQSFNRYAYTRNDPVNFVDPTGLMLDARNRFVAGLVRGMSCAMVGIDSRENGLYVCFGEGGAPIGGGGIGDDFGGGTAPQGPSQPQTNKDCYAFADEVTRLMNRLPAIKAGNVTEVANELWRRFENSGDEFGSDGFKREVADHGGSPNQARHYSGGFMAATVAIFFSSRLEQATGAAAGMGAVAANAARETHYLNINPLGFPILIPMPPTRNQEVARALNRAAAAHAHLLKNGKVAPKKLGALIRQTICEPRR